LVEGDRFLCKRALWVVYCWRIVHFVKRGNTAFFGLQAVKAPGLNQARVPGSA
jgi:hypothetical protein